MSVLKWIGLALAALLFAELVVGGGKRLSKVALHFAARRLPRAQRALRSEEWATEVDAIRHDGMPLLAALRGMLFAFSVVPGSFRLRRQHRDSIADEEQTVIHADPAVGDTKRQPPQRTRGVAAMSGEGTLTLGATPTSSATVKSQATVTATASMTSTSSFGGASP